MQTKLLKMALAITLALGVTACGDKDKEKAAPSQVLARVNDQEITVSQLNVLLAGAPNATEADKQKTLDKLVEQELLVQEAIKQKLDRDPRILGVIEQTRKQILAKAMAENMAGQPAKASAMEVSNFFNSHPALFAERKGYLFDTFLIPQNKLTAELEAQLNQSKTAAETEAILKGANVEFKRAPLQKLAEQLPLELLPKFAAQKVGDILNMPEGAATLILQLRETKELPVTLAQATPLIEKYLKNGASKSNYETKLKAVQTAAKVEYVKRFADKAADTAKPAATPAVDEHLKAGVKGL